MYVPSSKRGGEPPPPPPPSAEEGPRVWSICVECRQVYQTAAGEGVTCCNMPALTSGEIFKQAAAIRKTKKDDPQFSAVNTAVADLLKTLTDVMNADMVKEE